MTFLAIPWFRLDPWHIPLPFEIFGLDSIPIQPFGVLVAIGVLISMRVGEWFGKLEGVSQSLMADLATHVVVTGFLCAYFLNALFYEPDVFLEVLTNPTLLFKRYLGLSSYGGLIGGLLGVIIWQWRRLQPFMFALDAGSFSFPIAFFFGRTGCFVVHDHPGLVTDFALAVQDYHVGSPPYETRHDLGLYEAICPFFITVLFFILRRKRRPYGFYAALLPILYAPVRFSLDFLRIPPSQGGDTRYQGE